MTDDEQIGLDLTDYRKRVKVRVAAIKIDLNKWAVDYHLSDQTLVTSAMLETAFEREIELLGEDDAFDIIKRAFARVAKKQRGTLQ